MSEYFKELAKFAFAGNSERSKILNTYSFENKVLNKIPNTPYHKKQKELLKSQAVEETTLLQEAVYDTIVEGGMLYKCFRDVLPVVTKDGYALRVVYGSGNTYAKEVPEATTIEVETSKLKKVTIDINKYGIRPLITNELIEDALWDIVEWELQNAGQALENRLNRECLSVILKSGSQSTDAGGAFKAATIASGCTKVRKHGFLPDTVIMHPGAEGKLFQDTNIVYANYWGSPGPLQTGVSPGIMGCKPYICSVTTGDDDAWGTAATATPLWNDTDAANTYAALVLDSRKSAMIAFRRDYTVEKYDDPIHDMVGINATMRFGVKVIHDDAFSRVLY